MVVLGWLGALVLGSVASGETKAAMGTQGEWHRVWHVGVFGTTVMVLAWGWGLRAWQAGWGTFGVGLGCEVLQRLIYIPVMEWGDVGDDAWGALLGWVLVRGWRG